MRVKKKLRRSPRYGRAVSGVPLKGYGRLLSKQYEGYLVAGRNVPQREFKTYNGALEYAKSLPHGSCTVEGMYSDPQEGDPMYTTLWDPKPYVHVSKTHPSVASVLSAARASGYSSKKSGGTPGRNGTNHKHPPGRTRCPKCGV